MDEAGDCGGESHAWGVCDGGDIVDGDYLFLRILVRGMTV